MTFSWPRPKPEKKERNTIDKFPEYIQRQIAKAFDEDYSPLSTPKPEQRRSTPLGQTSKAPRITTPVYIVVNSFKTGTGWDVDNATPKSLIDGLVHSQIIEDDSIEFVTGVCSFGYRVKKREEERTEILIYETQA